MLPMAASESSIIDVWQVSAETGVRRCSSKGVVLKILQYLQEKDSVETLFNRFLLQLYQKETSTHVFPCEYCKMFKKSFL